MKTSESLRAAAEFIDQHPDIEVPFISTFVSGLVRLDWIFDRPSLRLSPEEQRQKAVVVFDAVGETWDMDDQRDPHSLAWTRQQGPLLLAVRVCRAAIAEVTC